jgi:hypothetical protein
MTAGILVLHSVEQHCSFQSRLIATGDIGVLVCYVEELLANRPAISLGEAGQFTNDFGGAH